LGKRGTRRAEPTTVFTNYLRDSETNNDYAYARYYANRNGRFISPDPLGGSTSNPQSLNRYVYAVNDPLAKSDPTGRECVWDDGSFDSFDDPDTGSPDGCGAEGGTWIGHDIFINSTYYPGGDWSASANDPLSGLVQDIQSCSAAVGGGQAEQLLIADAFASGFTNEMTAYVLSTAQWESKMGTLMTELGAPSYFSKYDGRLGNTNPGDAVTYKGRGYVQITGKDNYQTWSNELGVDLVKNPALAATPDIAAQIAVEGMDRGAFTNVSLYNYVNPSQADFFNARSVINADKYSVGRHQTQNNGTRIAQLAAGFLANGLGSCR